MSDNSNRTYRVRTVVGGKDPVIHVNLNQNFDILETLSLTITQEDAYKLYSSSYGVLVGRVLANNGFGVPNAKVSIFVPVSSNEISDITNIYNFSSPHEKDINGIRYNLLTDTNMDECHQNVGTFPNKRYLLDNDLLLEIYDEYFKYTTTTNKAGDYMLFGIPTGSQNLHVDIDLSDIGVLSQRPRDMVYKGYNINQFENPNQFKSSTNLDSLSQIFSQDASVFIYPFWGDTSEDIIAITRHDINLNYLFEPTCVFMGSVFSDTHDNSLGNDCIPAKDLGTLNTLVSSVGTIEMIRYTIDGHIENYQINGNNLIDSDGVFCYQIPMNLDYVVTDEYGNMIPSDDPNKGIPTRSRVRFRFSMDNPGSDGGGRTRAMYLVPNNPKDTGSIDYSFGASTSDNNFVDLLWNKVYSVKNYIGRTEIGTIERTRNFVGIKNVNKYGSNNPFPYNNVIVKLSLTYTIICFLMNLIMGMAKFINKMIRILNKVPLVNIKPISFSITDDSNQTYTYIPDYGGSQEPVNYNNYMTVFEGRLAEEYNVILFDFVNDWINGSLYFPLFLKKDVTKKHRRFLGLFGSYVIKSSSYFCDNSINSYNNHSILQPCAPAFNYSPNGFTYIPNSKNNNINGTCDNGNCDQESISVSINCGLIKEQTTGINSDNFNYYYAPTYFDSNGNAIFLHTTDIILIGGLNDCDIDGIPPLHQYLPSTTYNMPPITTSIAPTIIGQNSNNVPNSVITGVNWGKEDVSKGLFVGMRCSGASIVPKSCINAKRVCELNVDLDQTIYNAFSPCGNNITINSDGLITSTELTISDPRAIFATLNNNRLITTYSNTDGYNSYEFKYIYPNGFDGKLQGQYVGANDIIDNNNYQLFRLGNNPLYYSQLVESTNYYRFERYVNSFYFYFGLNPGKTAIEKFNNLFYATCSSPYQSEILFHVTTSLPPTLCDANGNPNNGSASIIIDEGEVQSVYITNSVGKQTLTDLYYPQNNIYLFSKLPFDDYTAIVTDYQNNIYQKNFQIVKSNVLKYNYIVKNMSQSSLNLSLNNDDIMNPNINKGQLIINNIYIIDPKTSLSITNGNVNIEIIDITSGNTVLLNNVISYSINNPIIYYLCSGTYQLTLTNPNCSEDTITNSFNISEPQPLNFTINGIDYLSILSKLTSPQDWLNLTYNNWSKLAPSYKKISEDDRTLLLNAFTAGTISACGQGYDTMNLSIMGSGGNPPYSYNVTFPNGSSSNLNLFSNDFSSNLIYPTMPCEAEPTSMPTVFESTYSVIITDSNNISTPLFSFYLYYDEQTIGSAINPTVTLSSPTTILFNQTAINNVLNFSYIINSLGAIVNTVSLEWCRNNSNNWIVLSTDTTITTFTHSMNDTNFNTEIFNYRYIVTDTMGGTATATFNIMPQAYVSPSITFSAAATTLYNSIETNTNREVGNYSSILQGSVSRISPNVDIISYQYYVSTDSGATYNSIGSLLSLSPNGGILANITDTTELNGSGTLMYKVGVNDAYKTTYSTVYNISYDYLIFYGDSASNPTTSSMVRNLNNIRFLNSGNIFILNTGTENNIFTVAMPSSVSLVSVIDIDAFNSDITFAYIKTIFNVNDIGGNPILYNVYTLVNALPYNNNHRHQITIS